MQALIVERARRLRQAADERGTHWANSRVAHRCAREFGRKTLKVRTNHNRNFIGPDMSANHRCRCTSSTGCQPAPRRRNLFSGISDLLFKPKPRSGGARKRRPLIEPLEERRVLTATLVMVSAPHEVVEGDLDGFGQPVETVIEFTFRLEGELTEEEGGQYVEWEINSGGEHPTNPGTDTDFDHTNDWVYFPVGTQWADVTRQFTIVGDLLDEYDETFRIDINTQNIDVITNNLSQDGLILTMTAIPSWMPACLV